MKDFFFLIIGISIFLWSFYIFLGKPAAPRYQEIFSIHIGEMSIKVETADTNQERSRGLSGRYKLETGYGMLFVFEKPGINQFWMKDMRFPIDIVWIDTNWVVMGVEKDVLPESFPETFTPPRPVKYVLELNAGEAEFYGIDTGTEMYFDNRI